MKIKPLNDLEIIDFVRGITSDGYLVGGCVRDWYIGKKCFDIDITFKEYPVSIARKVAGKFNFKLEEFERFLTLRLTGDNKKIDFATFRREVYPSPASLPVVEKASSIEEDLKRRDFSVNAIAVSLIDYEVKDVFGGVNDIDNKLIRVLHERSFIDDPTRIFRAIRFSVRFNWNIFPETLFLMERDKKYVLNLSRERIRNELIKILMEDKCYKMLEMIKSMKILKDGMLFDFDDEIDRYCDLMSRYLYIYKKNGMHFFEFYNFEKKIKSTIKNFFN